MLQYKWNAQYPSLGRVCNSNFCFWVFALALGTAAAAAAGLPFLSQSHTTIRLFTFPPPQKKKIGKKKKKGVCNLQRDQPKKKKNIFQILFFLHFKRILAVLPVFAPPKKGKKGKNPPPNLCPIKQTSFPFRAASSLGCIYNASSQEHKKSKRGGGGERKRRKKIRARKEKRE